MPFAFLKGLRTNVTNQFNGNKDLLEAIAAGAMLVAYADGNASDDEILTANQLMKSNQTLLSGGYTATDIERCVDNMYDRAKAGRSGRAGLYKEIDDVAKVPAHAEAVMWGVIDVADNGGIDEAEMTVLKNIAQRLGQNLDKYLAQA